MTTTMPTTARAGSDGESLADRIRRGVHQARADAARAISGIAAIAARLEMPETAKRLTETERKLRSDTFKVIVTGRFKVGKSVTLNALLGGTTVPVELADHQGPMVVDDLPATATLTGVRYAEQPYVKAWGFDGTAESWTLDRYLAESALSVDEQESQLRFGHIQQFEMGFPAKLCQAGIEILDSPGNDENELRTKIARDASERCDAAIVVYRSDALMGKNELLDADKLIADGTRIFTLVNLWDDRRVDDKLRAFVWNKYIRDHRGMGATWQQQDLTEHDIYFVNSEMARRGVYGDDPAAVAASGLPEFESRLAHFLTSERQQIHLRKFTTQAENHAATIEQHLGQRRHALLADRESLREAARQAISKLDAIRARPARLPQLIARCRADADRAIKASFASLVAGIRQEMPAHLDQITLPSAESKLLLVFKQKKLQQEAAEAISAYVLARINTWSVTEVPDVMRPLLERLCDDIRHEVTAISRELDAITVEFTGDTVEATATTAVVGRAERVMAAAAGLLFGDVSAAVTGGAGGWRGAAGGISGALGSAFVLGILGVSSAFALPVVLAVALFAGIASGGLSLESRVKNKAVGGCDEMLRALPSKAQEQITAGLDRQFTELEDALNTEIAQVIDAEAANIQNSLDLNELDQGERTRALAELDRDVQTLATCREALAQALTTARQVV